MKKVILVTLLALMLSACSAGGHLELGQNDTSVVQTTTVV